jgi:moderate conductance mechanosensitive channel
MEQIIAMFETIRASGWGGVLVTGLRILVIVIVALVAMRVLQRLIRLFRERITRRMDDPEQVKRAQTLGHVFRYLAAVGVTLVAAIEILHELDVSLAPILGAAGVVGLAIGFGAQSLVKDYFTGFFILLENQLRQGDVVEVGGKSGLVEEVTLRYVRLRDYDGNVHYVPNSLITTVTNMGKGHARAVVDVRLAYRDDIERALGVMQQLAAQLREDPSWGPRILEEPEIVGVDRLEESAVILRLRFMVRPLEQWNVRREYLRRLRKRFDAEGIEIPFPQLTVHAAADARDSAAAASLRQPPTRDSSVQPGAP